MTEYLDYFGNMPLPGATAVQDNAIEFALRMVDAAVHDGLKRDLLAVLGANGFSDQQLQSALLQVLSDHAAVYLPPALFPRLGLVARLSQAQKAQTNLAAAAALGANAITA